MTIKYIPGTAIRYDVSRHRKGTWTFERDDQPIAFCQSMADAGWQPVTTDSALIAPPKRPTGNPDELEVWGIDGRHLRTYKCRAILDQIETEVLAGDRKAISLGKLNRAGHKSWLEARMAKCNIRFMRQMGIPEADMLAAHTPAPSPVAPVATATPKHGTPDWKRYVRRLYREYTGHSAPSITRDVMQTLRDAGLIAA